RRRGRRRQDARGLPYGPRDRPLRREVDLPRVDLDRTGRSRERGTVEPMSTAPSGPAHPSVPSPAADNPWTTSAPPTGRTTAGVVTLAVVLDVVSVLVFAAGGRATHSADSPLSAVAGIAWPFLVGL